VYKRADSAAEWSAAALRRALRHALCLSTAARAQRVHGSSARGVVGADSAATVALCGATLHSSSKAGRLHTSLPFRCPCSALDAAAFAGSGSGCARQSCHCCGLRVTHESIAHCKHMLSRMSGANTWTVLRSFFARTFVIPFTSLCLFPLLRGLFLTN
jgi:hypothetical protein